MENNQWITIIKSERTVGENEYKVIKIIESDPAKSLYAVCTPIKMK